MIKIQSAQAVAAQAENMPKSLDKLIDVLYGGMLQGPFAKKT